MVNVEFETDLLNYIVKYIEDTAKKIKYTLYEICLVYRHSGRRFVEPV